MTYDDEIKERKEIEAVALAGYIGARSGVVHCFETRIMHLDADLEEARQDLENEKALTAKLKGLLDGGMVELVGEMDIRLMNLLVMIKLENIEDSANDIALTIALLKKSKEVMP